MFWKRRFMEWEEYEKRVNYLNMYSFQQSVRRENLKNASSA